MYEALGHRFNFTCPDASAHAYMSHILSGLAAATTKGAALELALHPTEAVDADAWHTGDNVTLTIGKINLRAIAAATGSLLLHAGSVARPDGGAAILCGPSGSGKSTLTAVLSARHSYVTDETVCVAPENLRITPFRKPLVLKKGAHDVLPHLRPTEGSIPFHLAGDRWFLPPASLDTPELPTRPLFPQVTIFPTHRQGTRLEVEEVSSSEAAYLLTANGSQLPEVRGGVLSAVARFARRTPCYRISFGEPAAAAEMIEELWTEAA